jgi:predicted metalloprotease with PDZ domain
MLETPRNGIRFRSILIRVPLLLLVTLGVVLGATAVIRAQCHFARTTTVRTVTYRFQPEVGPGGLVLRITFEFQTGARGMETLVVPTSWAGETLHAMTNLRVTSKDAALTDGPEASTKIVRAPAHRMVVIVYDLKKDWAGPLLNPLQFHPVLMPEYFEFTGSNALVRLKLDDGARETVNFDWQELPAAWTLATSFGVSSSTTARCQTHTGPWIEANHGLYAAGDYRIHKFQIGRRPAFLAVRGAWMFTDDEAITQIQKVVGLVRDFWHDDNFPYFLVTLKPYDRDHGSSDGSAFTNAFWMYVSRLDSLTNLLPQLAHESFHAWDPDRMGSVPTGYSEKSIKWFREGPTEYYAQLLTYRAGELSLLNYVNSLNRDLRSFPTSTSEYVRGRIISLWLDGTIRRESDGQHSLDNVMFDMVRGANQPYTLARILATAGRYLSPESRALLRHAVNDHGDLPAPERIPSVGDCAHASLQDVASFDPGLDLDRTRTTGVISGVVEGGPAFMAGLRDGQPLLGISVVKGEPERLARFKVHATNGDKWIEFYPRGKSVSAWQYQIDPGRPCERGAWGSYLPVLIGKKLINRSTNMNEAQSTN